MMSPHNDKYEEVVNCIEFDLNRSNKQEVLQLLRKEAEKCEGCQNSAIWNILATLTCDSEEFDWHLEDFVSDQLQDSSAHECQGNDGEEKGMKKYIIYLCVAGAAFAIGYWIGKKHFHPPPIAPPPPQFSYLDIHPYVNVLKKLWVF